MGLLSAAIRRDIIGMTSSMMPAQQERVRRPITRARLGLVALLLSSLSLPAFAQVDTGTSGIPLGPANINGQFNTVRDPSGIGNAARMPALPQSTFNPAPVPSAPPLISTQPSYTPLVRDRRTWQHLSKRERQRLERAAVKENDRLLRHGAVSICRGC
jgi:hypothetical protein